MESILKKIQEFSQNNNIKYPIKIVWEGPRFLTKITFFNQKNKSLWEYDLMTHNVGQLFEEEYQNIKMIKTKANNKKCSICFDNIEADTETRNTPCHHIFHDACLKPWLQVNLTCPYCRDRVDVGLLKLQHIEEKIKKNKTSSYIKKNNCFKT